MHLKRFQHGAGGFYSGLRGKIDDVVDFPTRGLDLSRYAVGPQDVPPVYDLFAVSEHSGGLGGGHYTAKGLNFRNKQWYSFNDSSASPTTEESCVRSTAYVLLYRKRVPGSWVPGDAVSAPEPVGPASAASAASAVGGAGAEDVDMGGMD